MSELRKIAILGNASSSLNQAPFEDESWEIWALGRESRRVDRYFEIHHPEIVNPELIARYKSTSSEVFVMHDLPGVANAVYYPVEIVQNLFKTDYFTSSIAWMIALAIMENASEIGLWGIDMICGDEYINQRPCVEYWIGIAKGNGIIVHIPETSALCKANFVYGLTEKKNLKDEAINIEFLKNRIEKYKLDKHKISQTLAAIDGASQEAQLLIDYLENYSRGGIIPGKGE